MIVTAQIPMFFAHQLGDDMKQTRVNAIIPQFCCTLVHAARKIQRTDRNDHTCDHSAIVCMLFKVVLALSSLITLFLF